MEEQLSEDELIGEDVILPSPTTPDSLAAQEPIKEKRLTFEEASKSLSTLGKDESGVRYAFLMMSPTQKKLTDITIVVNFKHLLFLDLSDNYLNLEALQVVSKLPYLIFLRAERNRVESVGLERMSYLQVLILTRNQVQETGDLDQPMLETLELAHNSIYTPQFVPERLVNLKELGLRGNHLLDTSGTFPSSLEKLFLCNNGIRKINTDFSKLPNLKQLHLRDNKIRKLSGITEDLANLSYLNLRGNRITKVRQFRHLDCLPKLETLIITDNPVYSEKQEEDLEDEEEREEEVYGEDGAQAVDKVRVPLLVLLPSLKRINKDLVTLDEREAAAAEKKSILKRIFDEDSSDDETEVPTTTDFTTDYTAGTEVDLEYVENGGSEEKSDEEEDQQVKNEGGDENETIVGDKKNQ
ncbi:unnamed protein product [Phaedon cochleariae]|uniref:Leucine-rich repeat-containing protein 23 n=1 Tax=Phaedon cochleariae TaxID=80249 RepID=A0A9P0DJP7_PHACE|nr:unnamed protein product [Phaedon cochleariae]